MKHWGRYSSACRWIAARTASGGWPRSAQPRPPAKSTYSRPSASQTRAPSARETTSGGVEIPLATKRSRPSCTCSVELRSRSVTVPRLYMDYSGEQSASDQAEVGHEAREHAFAVVGAQDGARVDRRRHQLCELRVERPPAVLRHLEVPSEQALRGCRTEQDEGPRLHEGEFCLEPGPTGHLLGPARLVVDPAWAASLPFEVLDGVRDVRRLAVDAGLVEGAVEELPGRPDER